MDQLRLRLHYLFSRYKDGSASASERDALLELLQQHGMEGPVKELIADETEAVDSGLLVIDTEQTQARANELLQKILATVEADLGVISMKDYPAKRKRWRYGAAAAILLVLAGTYLLFNTRKNTPTEIARVSPHDLAPGHDGAILTLDNGEQIVLDSVHNGLIAQQSNTNIIKKGPGLRYEPGGKATAVSYNTITTPKGRQYPNLILADGSKVWLDAGSSIRFPVSFSGGERRVEITGQVWFDVVHNSKMPFKVIAKGTEINDLGTQFNVNAYSDEEKTNVTLLQGAIKIQSAILRPGQQAQIPATGKMQVTSNVDVDHVLAWKNGFFSFKNADLKTIMRQVARWYNVEVVFEGNVQQVLFSGEIGRQLTLTQFLSLLDSTRIHYSISENKLLILP